MRGRVLALGRYRLGGLLRRRWAAHLTLVVLLALVGGVGMAAVQAARRTQAAFPTYLAKANAPDLVASVYNAYGAPSTDLRAAIEHLPGVARISTIYVPHILPLAPDGAPRYAVLSSVTLLASPDGLGTTMDRLTAVDGHLADPGRTDDLVLDANAARLLGARVGSVIPMGIFTQSESSPLFGTPRLRPAQRVQMHVVGIVVENTTVVQDDVDRAFGFGYLTPALLRDTDRIDPGGDLPISYALRLTHGAAGVTQVETDIRRLLPRGTIAEFHATSREVTTVELAVRPISVALGGFGAIAALACLVLGLQAISRLLREGEEDRRVLRGLGASTPSVVVDAMAGPGIAVVAGTAAAIGVAIVLSPLSPIGPVRPVYPDRGIAFDVDVYVVGAAVLLSTLLLGAALQAVRGVRPARRSGAPWHSSVARRAEALGLPVTSVVGIRFALEPGSRPRAVPFRSVLLGTVVAVGLVVATLTFSSSFQTLVANPPLYGWNWNYAMLPTNNMPSSASSMLDHDPLVAAWTGIDYNIVTIDGLSVPVLMEHGSNDRVLPPVLTGHGVDGPRQIVIGGSTLAELHRRIGQDVEVSLGTAGQRHHLAAMRFHVVGTATFPAIGYSSEVADHTSMGIGALFSEASIPRAALQGSVGSADPNLQGAELVVVRLRPGVGAAAGRSNLDRMAATFDRMYAADPQAAQNSVSVLGVLRPAQIVNYQTIGSTPVVLAVALAVGALAALAFTLIASVRRRRRELALMKALGFTPRQLASAIAWQSSVAAVTGVVVGTPLGVVLGRELWILFARGLDAVPDPTVPLVTLLLVALGSLLFANLVALVPGRTAARTPTAAILRVD